MRPCMTVPRIYMCVCVPLGVMPHTLMIVNFRSFCFFFVFYNLCDGRRAGSLLVLARAIGKLDNWPGFFLLFLCEGRLY